jgi:hypothetical protein
MVVPTFYPGYVGNINRIAVQVARPETGDPIQKNS